MGSSLSFITPTLRALAALKKGPAFSFSFTLPPPQQTGHPEVTLLFCLPLCVYCLKALTLQSLYLRGAARRLSTG